MTLLSKNARVAGFLYILASVVGVVRLMYIPNVLFVSGNATATAANVAAHESLFRWGIVSSLLGAALWLFVPLALYRLLKGVDQTLAVLMVILGSLMQVPLFVINVVTDAAALLFARGPGYLSVFDKPQRDAFARLFLDLHHQLDLANFMCGPVAVPIRPAGVQIALPAPLPWRLADTRRLRVAGFQPYQPSIPCVRGQGVFHHPTDCDGRGGDHALARNHGCKREALGCHGLRILKPAIAVEKSPSRTLRLHSAPKSVQDS